MARTFNRPVAKGKVSIAKASWFAAALGVMGFVVLSIWVNMLTAWLTLASLVGYAVVYTMFLKRATPQNIVIGGIAGAAPPLLGWTAVTGEIHAHALLLVLIVFTWTPPHFWALAIHREKDYAKAKVPMLPVTHGVEFTKTSVLLYTVLLSLVCLLPYLVGMSDLINYFQKKSFSHRNHDFELPLNQVLPRRETYFELFGVSHYERKIRKHQLIYY